MKVPPRWRSWERLPSVSFRDDPRPALQGWLRQRLQVLVGLGPMEFRGESRLQHTLSICTYTGVDRTRSRSTDEEVAVALRDFGMAGAEEDNHQPGIIRMFFLLADLRPGEEGIQCECKSDEQVVVEPDGFRWSRTRDFDESRYPEFLRGRAVRRLAGDQ